MNHSILNKEVQDFINSNLKSDLTKLILKGSPFAYVSVQEIAEQILAKNSCEKKLPTWFNSENIYYPNKLNIEQTSSEITAKYKSDLVSGESLIDITGGFGVDAYYFSHKIKNITHCEIAEELSAIVSHNFKQFKVKNIATYLGDGIEFLQKSEEKFDWIYADPSRRNDVKEKVFLLKDCLPNIPEYMEAQTKINAKAIAWQNDIEKQQKEIESLKADLNNEKALLTKALIEEKEEDIQIKELDLKNQQIAHFGTNGDLFFLRQQLVKPVQDIVYNAIQDIATKRKFDFVMDKSSALLMLYTNKEYDISELVLNSVTRSKKVEAVKEKQNQKEGKVDINTDENVEVNTEINNEALQEKIDDREAKKEALKNKIEEQKAEKLRLREEQKKAIEEKRQQRIKEIEAAKKAQQEKKENN